MKKLLILSTLFLLVLPGTARAYDRLSFKDADDMGPAFPIDIKTSTGQYMLTARGSARIHALAFSVQAYDNFGDKKALYGPRSVFIDLSYDTDVEPEATIRVYWQQDFHLRWNAVGEMGGADGYATRATRDSLTLVVPAKFIVPRDPARPGYFLPVSWRVSYGEPGGRMDFAPDSGWYDPIHDYENGV